MFSVIDFNATLPIIPTLLKEVKCIGDESSIVQCLQDEARYHLCHHYEDIVIQCTGNDLNL